MYTLIIEDRHGRSAAEISFEQGSYTIGRVDGNDVVLPSNSVSRTHARIFVSNNKCYIDDLGSANGVVVDGIALKTRTEIKNGSKIRIGEYTLYLEYKDVREENPAQDVLKTQIVSSGQSGFKIVRIGDKFAGEEFMLSESNNSIGRTEDNYILLSDPSISRNHAKIQNIGMTFRVADLESSNGTFVNKKRIRGEVMMQTGDEIRFGNVRFIFVPATQSVDISQYSRRRAGGSKVVLITLISAALLIVTVFAIVFVYIIKKDKGQSSQVVEAPAEDPYAVLNGQLEEANRSYLEGRLDASKTITTTLLKTWPNESRVIELHRKIENEIHYEGIVQYGDQLYDQRKYTEALAKYREVRSTAMSYARVKERITETERKIQLAAYNDARSKCDEKLSNECINEMCEASLELKNAGHNLARVEEAVAFLKVVASKKTRYTAAAKNCLKRIAL